MKGDEHINVEVRRVQQHIMVSIDLRQSTSTLGAAKSRRENKEHFDSHSRSYISRLSHNVGINSPQLCTRLTHDHTHTYRPETHELILLIIILVSITIDTNFLWFNTGIIGWSKVEVDKIH